MRASSAAWLTATEALDAIRRTQGETRALCNWAEPAEAGIFDAQLLFLEDPAVVGRASCLILEERCNAEFAWQTVVGQLPTADAPDLAARVVRILSSAAATIPKLAQPSIVVAHDLTPSEVKELDPRLTLGLCLETGSASAHSAHPITVRMPPDSTDARTLNSEATTPASKLPKVGPME